MKAASRRYVAFKLQLGKLGLDSLGDVTIPIAKRDLVALQNAWAYVSRQYSTAHGSRSERAVEARAMSGTLYNLATSKQRGAVVDVRVHWRMARIFGRASRALLADVVLINDEAIAAAAQRATEAFGTAGPSPRGRPKNPLTPQVKAHASQSYRKADSAHNSRIRRAKLRLRENQI